MPPGPTRPAFVLRARLLGLFVLVPFAASTALGADPPPLEFAAAYHQLLALFPEEHAGRGIDRGDAKGVVADHPMTYGLVLSAESLRHRVEPTAEGRRRVRAAARWLCDNSRLGADGKPGWGLPYAWNERPRDTSYTITTAIVVEGLLDALEADVGWTAEESAAIVALMRAVNERWCTDLWIEGQGGGYFCYCDHDALPCAFCVNAPAMFLGSLARFVHDHAAAIPVDQRRLFVSRGDALAAASVATATLRDGAPYWDYITAPHNPVKFQRPNDLIHQAYILWGLETYRDHGGAVPLPWTRDQAVESLDRFWKDGTMRFFAQDEATIKPGAREDPANLWGAGMLLACYARWDAPEKSRRCFDAILADYGPFPRMRVLPASASDDETSYPRDNAHVLFGLAHVLARSRARPD